jgi:hypothetical protein
MTAKRKRRGQLSRWRLGNATVYDDHIEFARGTTAWIAPDYLDVRLDAILKLPDDHPLRTEEAALRHSIAELEREPIPDQLPPHATKYIFNAMTFNKTITRSFRFLERFGIDPRSPVCLKASYIEAIKTGDVRLWLATETLLQTWLLSTALRRLDEDGPDSDRSIYEAINRAHYLGKLHDRWGALDELPGVSTYDLTTGTYVGSIQLEVSRASGKQASIDAKRERYRALYLDKCLPAAKTTKEALLRFAVLVGIADNVDATKNVKHPEKSARRRLSPVFPHGIPKPNR